jgi:hypothetical protein
MCQIVVINKGEKEITTPQEFKDHFGFMPITNWAYNELMMDACLCQCEIEETLLEHKIPFVSDCGDIYIEEQPNTNAD